MNSFRRKQRGSLLLVSLLICLVIGLTLSSYLTVANQAQKMSQRSFLANEAMNLAETGIELAIVAINTSTWGSSWETVATATNDKRATFTGFTYSDGVTGTVRVYVKNATSSDPTVITKATLQPKQGASVEKIVSVSGFVKRSLFGPPLVGRDGVTFNGTNTTVDSWDSLRNEDGSNRSSPANYESATAHAKGGVAALNITASASVNNADIYGTASVGSSSSSAIKVGSQGRVGPFGTAAGVKNPDYISTNFTMNLPDITAPDPGASANVITSEIKADLELPRTNDMKVTSGGKDTYYYKFPSMSSGKLTIKAGANVVLLPTAGPGTDAIKLSGNGDAIVVGSGGTVNIYTDANISISGQAYISNASGSAYSSSIQVWGTGTATTSPRQSISVTGNGVLMCTCYAPNATISAKGGGNSGKIYGAFVGNTITLTGNDSFHYDEALGRMGVDGTYTPTKWVEITSATDRATYASYF